MEDPLAEELLNVEHPEGSAIKIKMNKSRDDLEFDWTKAEKTEDTKDAEGSADADSSEEAKEKEA